MLDSLSHDPWFWFLIFVGGAFGTGLRDWSSQMWMKNSSANPFRSHFPFATWIVNLLGSFGIGMVGGFSSDWVVFAFWISGVLGGLTTFSTFAWECVTLFQMRKNTEMIRYILTTFVAGLFAVWCGSWIAQTVFM